ncbi:MAG: hypothetical protein ABIL58_16675 [Pseudomonadota bacterium]
MTRHQLRRLCTVFAVTVCLLLPGRAALAIDMTEYTAATKNGRLIFENLQLKTQGKVLDRETEARITELIIVLTLEENRYYQLFIVGFDTCSDAAGLNLEITRRMGSGTLFIPPKADCVKPAPPGKAGRIEVWLVPVDDGA